MGFLEVAERVPELRSYGLALVLGGDVARCRIGVCVVNLFSRCLRHYLTVPIRKRRSAADLSLYQYKYEMSNKYSSH
eukprot:g67635.t1